MVCHDEKDGLARWKEEEEEEEEVESKLWKLEVVQTEHPRGRERADLANGVKANTNTNIACISHIMATLNTLTG